MSLSDMYSDGLSPHVMGLYSLSRWASYSKISLNLKPMRFRFILFLSLWNFTGTSAALLRRCMSNFKVIWSLFHPISRLWYFTRFDGKNFFGLVKRPWRIHDHERWFQKVWYSSHYGLPLFLHYGQVSNIRRTWVGNEIVDHSDVIGASPVGAAPTTSSFSTEHLVSIYCAKKTASRVEKHLSFGIWRDLY